MPETPYTLVTHPNGKCYGHLEWTDKGTTLVLDHCECQYQGNHPTVGCTKCGATDIPVIGHRCDWEADQQAFMGRFAAIAEQVTEIDEILP